MKRSSLLLLSAAALVAIGCELPVDDGQDYREPVPTADEVSARMSAASSGDKLVVYDFARDYASAVDVHTRALSGLVWDIAHSPPSHVHAKTAVWGPVRRPGFTADWRLSITDVGDMVYDYMLEGRSHGSLAETDFVAVLRGRGYGRAHAQHHAGNVAIDLDALQKAEPERKTGSGKLRVLYDYVSSPNTLTIEARPKHARRWVDLKLVRLEGGAGELEMKGVEDFGDEGADLEDLVLRGKWSKDGAGRADVIVSGGDYEAPSKISECWSQAHARVYARKNEQATGNASSCVFEDPAL